jgi:cobalt-zinc-cadmium efflux system protein
MLHEHHDHHHQDMIDFKGRMGKVFIAGIVLNAFFVALEFLIGVGTNSLALLSDAGHNLSDVITLLLAWLAYRLSSVKKTPNYTYGLQKSSVLVALINAFLLLFVVVEILWEAIQRTKTPVVIEGNIVAIVAFIGILVNGFTALLFLRGKEQDLNVKGAYLHMLSDALVSLGVVISGIFIYFTHWYWLDSVVSIVVAVVILLGTWSLLKDSVRLSLDGVPSNVDMEKIRQATLQVEGVKNIHHIHVWAISTTQNALTAHVVIDDLLKQSEILNNIKKALSCFNIQHCTIEIELNACAQKVC